MLRNISFLKAIGVLALYAVTASIHAEDWLPVTPEELKMKSEPNASAAPAIYLYRQVDRDDNESFEIVYARIKILTEEGRKYADIELPYDKATENIRGIQARTIRPDGSVAEFDGTVFEKPIIQGRGVKLLAKTFTLPDVQVGSIVEYRYRHQLQYGYVFNSHWILSQELFTKYAKFSLSKNVDFNLNFSWPVGLPVGTEPPKVERGKVRLETRDVPAFLSEEYMPPEDSMKFRVDFIYNSNSSIDKDPDVFWKRIGKQRYRTVEDYVNKRRVMEQAVAQIVEPGDSPEIELRKIYARTQQIRNLSFERAKSEQEIKREAQKEAKNVADVWNRGYGDGLEITWLFLALVRAAGMEANAVLVSTRDVYFFNQKVLNPWQLNSNVVVVKLEGKEMYFDPGTAFAPFGALPWNETAVSGLRLDKDGGTWVTTPIPTPADARIERKANLRLTTSGTLEGKITVTYTGLEAFWRRLTERNEDEADRIEFLENQIKMDIPTGIDVTVSNKPQWDSSDSTFVVEYDLKVPSWAKATGQRALLPLGLFGGREKNTFKHASRLHPLYFNFPYKSVDDITVELPSSWKVNSLPQTRNTDLKVVEYHTAATDQNGSLHIKRELVVNLLLLDKEFYAQLRDFFQTVRTGDEEQIVLAPSKP